jgi:hypothetical protein
MPIVVCTGRRDLSEELPKKRRRTEIFVSPIGSLVPIGRHNFKYRRVVDALGV